MKTQPTDSPPKFFEMLNTKQEEVIKEIFFIKGVDIVCRLFKHISVFVCFQPPYSQSCVVWSFWNIIQELNGTQICAVNCCQYMHVIPFSSNKSLQCILYFLSGKTDYLCNKWSYRNYQNLSHLKVTYRFYFIIFCSICPIISIEASGVPCCTGNPANFLPRDFQCTQKEGGLWDLFYPLLFHKLTSLFSTAIFLNKYR